MCGYLELAKRAAHHQLDRLADKPCAENEVPSSIPPAVTRGCDKSDRSDRSHASLVRSVFAVIEPGAGGDGESWFEFRVAVREFEADYPGAIAQRLAFNECVHRWHKLHGTRPDPAICTGCDKLLSAGEILTLPDGASVHLDSDFLCLVVYGHRWRAEAARELAALGLILPEASEA